MKRFSITAIALACALAVAPALAAQPADAAAKPNLRSCYDGKCTFTFTKPVSFRVSATYGSRKIRVSKVDAETVAVRTTSVRRVNGRVLTTGGGVNLGEGGRGSVGGLSFRVLSVTDRGATIRFTG
ncbi:MULTISPECIES: hypothetical protein [Nonomuraea]|uniref:Uncharacterized protein n=1 Tax=Nonomuraea ferruginea TaxID=46174 RepID=A0ABT4T9V8_9ACTN|nr:MULTISPECIES: hypothetical protein [Nonomuraea]MDA0645746.1 hypothetical protein [Nonomuraea ferruginea]TXK34689.1 hypothetical protein FR742_35750 [Nonomuraea sp. C10]